MTTTPQEQAAYARMKKAVWDSASQIRIQLWLKDRPRVYGADGTTYAAPLPVYRDWNGVDALPSFLPSIIKDPAYAPPSARDSGPVVEDLDLGSPGHDWRSDEH